MKLLSFDLRVIAIAMFTISTLSCAASIRAQTTNGEAPRLLPAPNETFEEFPNPRAGLGVRVVPLTPELTRDSALPVRTGAYITSIEKGSPADRAGLPLGGVIVAFDGQRIDAPADLVAAVQGTRAPRDVELTYYDGARLYRKTVHLLAINAPQVVVTPPERSRSVLVTPDRAAPARRMSLEDQLGQGGTRPLLGRFGEILDSVVAPAQAILPEPLGASPAYSSVTGAAREDEVSRLRRQVDELQTQMIELQRQVADLQRKLDTSVRRND